MNERVGDPTAPDVADHPEFLTVRELAQLLRIGKNQAYELVKSKQVPAHRFGVSIRIPRTVIERMLRMETDGG